MNFLKLFRNDTSTNSGRPWIEFPNSQGRTPVETLERLCSAHWAVDAHSRLVEIEGQGVGGRPDSYEVRCLYFFRRVIFTEAIINEAFLTLLKRRGLAAVNALVDGRGLDLTELPPSEAAMVINELFLRHLALKPYADGEHYNIAAY